MNYLLDTHTWLWLALQPNKLSYRVRKTIEGDSSELFLSPVSIWECANLHERKRLGIKGGLDAWLNEVFVKLPLQEVPITLEVARQAAMIRLPQPDFGDKFLAATALVNGLTLITADEQLLSCRWLKTLRAD